MPSIDFDRDVPLYPKRRSNTVSRFSTLLKISPSHGRAIAEWITDSRLKANMTQLVNLIPDNAEGDWLTYFLNILRNTGHPQAEREQARQHIFCYYQETFFWVVKKLWRKVKYLYPVATWNEVFECAGEDFEKLESAIAVLKHFDPSQSTRNYIRTIVYRKIRHWLEKQIGPHPRLDLISFDEQILNSEEEISTIQNIQTAVAEEQALKFTSSQRKNQHDRLLRIIEVELQKIERAFQAGQAPKIGKTQISLWVVLILSYGLNLMQSGAAKLLKANNLEVDQSALSRHLKTWKITLFIKCVHEFTNELKMNFTDGKESEENVPLEQNPEFLEFANEKHKLLDDILKDFCQNWIVKKVLQPARSEIQLPVEEGIIKVLDRWFQCYFKLVLDLTCLSEVQNKKFNKAVSFWQQELNL
ncbi:MAG: hypothetical protein J7647_12245 [Cyanobacteria bacterium SBLK]|nr:hypothetical protein [Cyanobacteria bacterium SBLK]